MNKIGGLPGPTNPGGAGIDLEARQSISELAAQVDDIEEDVTGLVNGGVDATARNQIDKPTASLSFTNLLVGHRYGAPINTGGAGAITWRDTTLDDPLPRNVCPKYERIVFTGDGNVQNSYCSNVSSRVMGISTKFALGMWVRVTNSHATSAIGFYLVLRNGAGSSLGDDSPMVTKANLTTGVGYHATGTLAGQAYALDILAKKGDWYFIAITQPTCAANAAGLSMYVTPHGSAFAAGQSATIDIMDWALIPSATILPLGVLNIIYCGDSISTAGSGFWTPKNTALLGGNLVANVAVSGATWKDYSDTGAYDGVPNEGTHDNVMGNQIQKIIAQAYGVPDLIYLSAGTNDTPVAGDLVSDIEAQFTSGGAYVALASADRKTIPGAIRWCVETLRNQYPTAKIILTTPIQSAEGTRTYASCKLRGDIIKAVGHRLGVPVIDHAECGIYGGFEASGSAGRYLGDGLHPLPGGGVLIADYNAEKTKSFLIA